MTTLSDEELKLIAHDVEGGVCGWQAKALLEEVREQRDTVEALKAQVAELLANQDMYRANFRRQADTINAQNAQLAAMDALCKSAVAYVTEDTVLDSGEIDEAVASYLAYLAARPAMTSAAVSPVGTVSFRGGKLVTE